MGNLLVFFRVFLASSLVWALLGQLVGAAAGLFLVRGIRAAAGLEPDMESEVALGAIFSVFGSLLFSGVLTDWLKWTIGRKTPLRHGTPDGMPTWSRYLNIDYNHKVIGIQYGITSIVVLLVGGTLALIFRLELSWPGLQFRQGLRHGGVRQINPAHHACHKRGVLRGLQEFACLLDAGDGLHDHRGIDSGRVEQRLELCWVEWLLDRVQRRTSHPVVIVPARGPEMVV